MFQVGEDVMGIMNDSVHSSHRDGTDLLGTGVNSLMLLAGVVLGAEDCDIADTSPLRTPSCYKALEL